MLVYVRGAGDIATGVAARLVRAGVSVVMADIAVPTCIRRTICFARPFAWARSRSKAFALAWRRRRPRRLRLPRRGMSPLWWTLRPRCSMSLNPRLWSTRFWLSATWAPRATWRLPSSLWGRALPRRLTATPWSRPCAGIFSAVSLPKGSPQPNTGVPGVIAGYGKERVIHSPAAGVFRSDRTIGDIVSAGDVIGYAGDTPMVTQIDGCLRGLLADGVQVTEGFKCADVDPRGDASYINYISGQSDVGWRRRARGARHAHRCL